MNVIDMDNAGGGYSVEEDASLSTGARYDEKHWSVHPEKLYNQLFGPFSGFGYLQNLFVERNVRVATFPVATVSCRQKAELLGPEWSTKRVAKALACGDPNYVKILVGPGDARFNLDLYGYRLLKPDEVPFQIGAVTPIVSTHAKWLEGIVFDESMLEDSRPYDFAIDPILPVGPLQCSLQVVPYKIYRALQGELGSRVGVAKLVA